MQGHSKKPLLTVAVPTFNRLPYLKQTLELLLQQKTEDVEIIVCDNCSTDETWRYLETLGDQIKSFRHPTNAGLDRNFLSCLSNASGDYVWTLCDDDLPCSNAVQSVLDAIRANSMPPALFITPQAADKIVSNYSYVAVDSEWHTYNRNEFLDKVGVWFTFGSSIVVKLDATNNLFIEHQVGSLLVPAAIMISTVGMNDKVLVSDKPLLYARSDNTGGYNGLVTFTKGLSYLLKCSRSLGYSPSVLARVYNHNLSMVVVLIVETWRINAKGLLTLIQYSYRSRSFYTHVVPALARRAVRSLKHAARSAKQSVLTSRRAQA